MYVYYYVCIYMKCLGNKSGSGKNSANSLKVGLKLAGY